MNVASHSGSRRLWWQKGGGFGCEEPLRNHSGSEIVLHLGAQCCKSIVSGEQGAHRVPRSRPHLGLQTRPDAADRLLKPRTVDLRA